MWNDYRIHFNASIDCVRVLLRQGLYFRGHDETENSLNPGNFLIQLEFLVDESRDVSKKEKMSVVIRYVDSSGHVSERFIGIEHVTSTIALSLKASIDKTFSRYNLIISKLRGQGFDGASNMQDFIVDVLERGEISSDRGLNQETNLQRARDTRWGSHYNSLICLISMFSAVSDVLEIISKDDSSFPDQKTEHCQKKDQDIVNAMDIHNGFGTRLKGLGEFSEKLMIMSKKIMVYPLVYKLLTLTLILPVATATVERVFSAMKIVKTSCAIK
ncbi:uncharacterized protein [Henckelia pumila]|uniref:uncharacterized protein n=1 Tax=Henckelia pumila TaxID=405737 RepID=UPI003C6E7415